MSVTHSKLPCPWHRYEVCRAAMSAELCPNSPVCAPLHAIMDGLGCMNPGVRRAYDAHHCKQQTMLLQPWFLAGATPEVLARTLRMSPEASTAFAYYFFDVEVFRDDIETLAWITDGPVTDEAAKTLLRVAHLGGLNALYTAFNRGIPQTDATTVLRNAMHQVHLHALRDNDPLQGPAKVRILRAQVTSAQQLSKTDKGGRDDLVSALMKLQSRDQTVQAPPPGAQILVN